MSPYLILISHIQVSLNNVLSRFNITRHIIKPTYQNKMETPIASILYPFISLQTAKRLWWVHRHHSIRNANFPSCFYQLKNINSRWLDKVELQPIMISRHRRRTGTYFLLSHGPTNLASWTSQLWHADPPPFPPFRPWSTRPSVLGRSKCCVCWSW